MAKLILVRHGQSEWNILGKWTGWTDIDLNDKGREEAKIIAQDIADIKLDLGFTSPLIRAKHTLEIILQTLHYDSLPIIVSDALKEKNYGDYTGKNKWEVKKGVGDEEFLKIRRSWDYKLPNGESLKDVYDRVIPYYQSTILPEVEKSKNVIVATHGNTLRAFIKFLDHVSDEDISGIEVATGEAYIYTLNDKGNVTNKETRASRPNTV